MWANIKPISERNNRRGFTIVELLIVIVVIGILAAITIVAYNGVQQRARNSATSAAAKAYYSIFLQYVTQNSQLPPSQGSNTNWCLAHPVNQCVNAAGSVNWSRDTTVLEPALQTITPTLPVPAITSATATTVDPNMGYIPFRGGTASPTLDGNNSAFLIYILEGTTSCPVGPIASGVWPNFSSTPPASGNTYTNNGLSVCWIPLPSK